MIKSYKNITLIPKIEPLQKISVIKGQNEILGEVFLETKRQIRNPNNITTFLKDKFDNIIGTEDLSYEKNSPNIVGLFIQVIPMLRQQNLGLGEILRLSSIIFMIENKIKEMEIFSKAEAVYFHSKYKFEPEIKSFDERNYALKSIIKNCQNEFEEIKLEAINIVKKVASDKSAENQRNLCKETNILLKEYIQEILAKKDKYKSHPFDFGFRMILNTNDILDNKIFFNNLFKKHKIDYEI